MYLQWNITCPLKKNEIMLFAATWMDIETVILSEVSQRRNIIWHSLCVELKQNDMQNVLTYFKFPILLNCHP